MIPNSDQLRSVAKMREGDLAEIPFAVLLHAMAAHEKSVVLEIERKPLKKEIVIENGNPVDCRSNLLHETLPRFMVTQGQITEEQSAEYLSRSATQGLRFEEALILDKVVSASDLYKVLQASLARKLLDGFTWRNGSFRVLGAEKVESPLKVKTPQLVVTGVSKFAGDEEVNGAVGPLVGKKLFLHPAPAYDVDEIRLSNAQKQVLSLLESGKRIDELAAETTVPFDKIMRLVYALALMGIAVPEDWLPSEPVAVKKKPKKAKQDAMNEDTMAVKLQQAATAPAMPLADLEKLSNRVMATYLRYRSLDAFDLLEVVETAGMVEVQDAFVAYSRKFAPWQFEAPGLQILVDKAADLFIAGGQAFGELCDVEKRNALIANRQNQREQAKQPDADRFAIKSKLLDSELQFKRGHALMQKGKYREAVTQLQFAYDCDPQNSIYRSELAYCRFLDNPREAERSADDLRETLRIDPKSGLATYYLGMVTMHLELYDESEQLLQRAIKMLMPDRRPIEALKDLQIRSKQKKKKLGFLGG